MRTLIQQPKLHDFNNKLCTDLISILSNLNNNHLFILIKRSMILIKQLLLTRIEYEAKSNEKL